MIHSHNFTCVLYHTVQLKRSWKHYSFVSSMNILLVGGTALSTSGSLASPTLIQTLVKHPITTHISFDPVETKMKWASSWDYGIYRIGDQRSSGEPALCNPHWIAAHARLKNEFTEDEKCHNLMKWLISCSFISSCWEYNCSVLTNEIPPDISLGQEF